MRAPLFPSSVPREFFDPKRSPDFSPWFAGGIVVQLGNRRYPSSLFHLNVSMVRERGV